MGDPEVDPGPARTGELVEIHGVGDQVGLGPHHDQELEGIFPGVVVVERTQRREGMPTSGVRKILEGARDDTAGPRCAAGHDGSHRVHPVRIDPGHDRPGNARVELSEQSQVLVGRSRVTLASERPGIPESGDEGEIGGRGHQSGRSSSSTRGSGMRQSQASQSSTPNVISTSAPSWLRQAPPANSMPRWRK